VRKHAQSVRKSTLAENRSRCSLLRFQEQGILALDAGQVIYLPSPIDVPPVEGSIPRTTNHSPPRVPISPSPQWLSKLCPTRSSARLHPRLIRVLKSAVTDE